MRGVMVHRLTALLLAGAVLTGCGGTAESRPSFRPGVTGRMVRLDDTGRPSVPDSGGGILASRRPLVVPVDADGHFRLTRSGRHLVCRTNGRDPSRERRASVGGCDLVDLPAFGALGATFGEGGFHAEIVPA